MVPRRRAAAQGLVRVQVQAPTADAALIRKLAQTLRGNSGEAEKVRASVRDALGVPAARTAFDVFGSDLPDEAFDGVFAHVRNRRRRDIDL